MSRPGKHSDGKTVIEVLVGENSSRSRVIFKTNETLSTIWPNGIPYDGSPQEILHPNHLALIITYSLLAAVGLGYAGVCLLFNTIFRNKKLVVPRLLLLAVTFVDACLQQGGSSCNDAVISAACRAWVMSPLRMSDSVIPLGCAVNPTISGCQASMIRSCQEILRCFPSAPSGYYQIHAPNGSLVQVYCDMEGTNCGGQGGWTRVAHVNMSQSGAICPQGLTERTFSGLTLCGRSTDATDECQGAWLSTLGLNYSRVCGQLRGYQYGAPDAFSGRSTQNINSPYVDGVSITHGRSSRKHIWTYASGFGLANVASACPCNTGLSSPTVVPSFVGGNYYCETGDNRVPYGEFLFQLFPNDTLWDGQQCVGAEASCCTPHPNMPWFTKTLDETATEDIEVRLCGDQVASDEDTPLQVIELFVY